MLQIPDVPARGLPSKHDAISERILMHQNIFNGFL